MMFYWTGNLLTSCNGERIRNTNQSDFIQHDFIKETSTKGNITKVDM